MNYLVAVLVGAGTLEVSRLFVDYIRICVYLFFLCGKGVCLLDSVADHNVSYVKALACLNSAVYLEGCKIIFLVLVDNVSKLCTVFVGGYRLRHICDDGHPAGTEIAECHSISTGGTNRAYRSGKSALRRGKSHLHNKVSSRFHIRVVPVRDLDSSRAASAHGVSGESGSHLEAELAREGLVGIDTRKLPCRIERGYLVRNVLLVSDIFTD